MPYYDQDHEIAKIDIYGLPKIEWSFSEFHKHERGLGWYIVSFLIIGALLIYSFFTLNYLFALILILFAFIVTMHHYQEPHVVRTEITDRGIVVGKNFYPYDGIDSFWIIYEPPFSKKLFMRKKNAVQSRIILPLEDNDPLKIREILSQFLPEETENIEDSLSDALGKLFKI